VGALKSKAGIVCTSGVGSRPQSWEGRAGKDRKKPMERWDREGPGSSQKEGVPAYFAKAGRGGSTNTGDQPVEGRFKGGIRLPGVAAMKLGNALVLRSGEQRMGGDASSAVGERKGAKNESVVVLKGPHSGREIRPLQLGDGERYVTVQEKREEGVEGLREDPVGPIAVGASEGAQNRLASRRPEVDERGQGWTTSGKQRHRSAITDNVPARERKP